jgi:lanthanide-dependent methanol dehydrogenase
MSAKNYASTQYSGLDQINTENVKQLQPAWTFSTGILRGQEALVSWYYHVFIHRRR